MEFEEESSVKITSSFWFSLAEGLRWRREGKAFRQEIVNPKPNIRSMLGEIWTFWLGQCACGEVVSHKVGR